MDGDTLIDCFDPQFTQREAPQLSGADNASINNWIHRGVFKLSEVKDRRLAGRRMFSIADIAALHTMHYCVRLLDIRPEAAGFAGSVVRSAFQFPDAIGVKDETGRVFEVWHLIKKSVSLGEDAGWSAQGIWQDRSTGAFFHYDPTVFGTGRGQVFGFPHFPCLSIPTSQIARRVFIRCDEYLRAEQNTVMSPSE